jgi:superfamily I DNA/RNA helicase
LDEDIDIKEFNTSMGNISLEFDDTYDGHRVRKNWALRIYDKARNMMQDPISIYRREKVKRLGFDKFVNIIRLYEEFKSQHRVDFTDMLKQFIEEGIAPSFDLMIIDEAQDLTPLQWKFVYKLGEKAKRIYLAGDDDQAIYEWNGADVRVISKFSRQRCCF